MKASTYNFLRHTFIVAIVAITTEVTILNLDVEFLNLLLIYTQCLFHLKDYGLLEQGDAAKLNIKKH
jgi:hypothetical protein